MAEILKNVCRICSAGCGVNVHVEGGKVVKIEGMPEFPSNEGVLCAKGVAAAKLIHSPDRILHPMKRVGHRGEGRWERVSWDEALETIATRLTEIRNRYGPQSLAMYEGQQWHWNMGAIVLNRFIHALGSPNYGAPGNMCWCPVTMAMLITYGPPYVYLKTLPGTFPYEEQPSKCIIFWGANPLVARMNRARYILDAREKGAKIIVIDPYLASHAAKAHIWAQIKPGTDLVLALGLIHVIIREELYDKEFVKRWTFGFDRLAEHVSSYTPEKVEEITWIPARLVEDIARLYAKNTPGIIEDHLGVTQQFNGFQTHRALCILRAITGNFDVKGGEVWLPIPDFFSKLYDLSLYDKIPPEIRPIGAERFPLWSEMAKWAPCCWGPAHISGYPKAILEGKPYPVKALITVGGNPLSQIPNVDEWERALKAIDFSVTIDLFMTATAKLSDFVLPAAWWLEKTDLSEQWPLINYVLLRQKVDPPAECWPEDKMILELSKRMGMEDLFPWKGSEEIINHVFSPLSVSSLRENPSGIWLDREVRYKKYEKEGFRTPSGKIELYSQVLERMGMDPLPTYHDYLEALSKELNLKSAEIEKEYPLILTKHISHVYLHSQFRNLEILREIEPQPLVEIFPDTAKTYGIMHGDDVVVESHKGSIEAKAYLTQRVHPKVIFMVHGWERANINRLISGEVLDPVSGSPATRECRVRIRKLQQHG